METHPADASAVLHEIHTDREALVARVPTPRTLLVLIGALAAAWVASAATTQPGADYEAPSTSWLALLGLALATFAVRDRTGIRLLRLGHRALLAAIAGVACCLTLYSLSLGLVAADLTWAVAVTTLVGLLVVTWLAHVAFRAALAEITRD